MRGKVAKGIRKAVYGANRIERKAKTQTRELKQQNESGTLMDTGLRRTYQDTKAKIKKFGVMGLVAKAKRGEVPGVAVQ